MNKDILQGQWSTLKGKIRSRWGKLTDDELEQVAGKREELMGRLQQAYGISKEEATKQIDEFEEKF